MGAPVVPDVYISIAVDAASGEPAGGVSEIHGSCRPSGEVGRTTRGTADPRDDRAEALHILRRRVDDARCRMRDRRLDQRILRKQADRRHDVAAVHRAEQHAGGGDTVGQHVRDDLAGAHAERRELRAQAPAPSCAARRSSARCPARARAGTARRGCAVGMTVDRVAHRVHGSCRATVRASGGSSRRIPRRWARAHDREPTDAPRA